MKPDAFKTLRMRYEEFRSLTTTLEKATKSEDDEIFWKNFATHAQAGLFDSLEVFKGLCHAVSIRVEREKYGKSLAGRRFEPIFDNFSTTLAAISPQGYRLFTEQLAGRTMRSQRDLRAKLGMKLSDGLAKENFD